ncbi:hypothetical protein [Caulobacter sp. RL271]|uniref:Uncharacterized protein n=1 Tax=Caulobacter segnis TaxID=88688 RepID=A0ABY4ZY54_9CAUL|nr:hypothetical protein [Caulobacter segnis]USQ97284.1 hypothetical protein MZV50_06995 [Caulobacter segnis]
MNVVQPWVQDLSLMQQSVLLSAIRGPDGSPKYGKTKLLVRWFRRCVLLGSFERAAFASPHQLGGGSFTGPSISYNDIGLHFEKQRWERFEAEHGRNLDLWVGKHHVDLEKLSAAELIDLFDREDGDWTPYMDRIVGQYLRELDALPHHFQLHLMHAAEILGYKHPDPRTRTWWNKTYLRLVHDMHLWPETEDQLDARLGDTRDGWLARNDIATVD